MPRKRKEIPEGYNENFPQRLRELIKEKGETQQGLADYIGRTRQLISYYSDGSSSPDWKTLARIAEYFGVTSDYLIGLSDAKQAESADIVEQLGISEENINRFKELKANADEAEEDFPHVKLVQAVNEVISELFEHNIFTLYADMCNSVLSVDSESYARYLATEDFPVLEKLAKKYGLIINDSIQESVSQISSFITTCNFFSIGLVEKYNNILDERKEEAIRMRIKEQEKRGFDKFTVDAMRELAKKIPIPKNPDNSGGE